MATLNISLPDELKARMDKAGGNWSSVARRAFELQLNSTIPTGADMNAVVARLKASKQKIEELEQPEWTAKGREWAMERAEYDELERVAALGDELDDGTREYPDAASLLEALAEALKGDVPDRFDLQDLSISLTTSGSRSPSYAQLCWYIDGVQQVWDEVADRV